MPRKKNSRKTTTVGKANTNSNSLRVTIPQFIVDLFDVEEGDELEWTVETLQVISVKHLRKKMIEEEIGISVDSIGN